MAEVLRRGTLGVTALSRPMLAGRQRWQQWHRNFALDQLPPAVAEDVRLRETAAAMDSRLDVLPVRGSSVGEFRMLQHTASGASTRGNSAGAPAWLAWHAGAEAAWHALSEVLQGSSGASRSFQRTFSEGSPVLSLCRCARVSRP